MKKLIVVAFLSIFFISCSSFNTISKKDNQIENKKIFELGMILGASSVVDMMKDNSKRMKIGLDPVEINKDTIIKKSYQNYSEMLKKNAK